MREELDELKITKRNNTFKELKRENIIINPEIVRKN